MAESSFDIEAGVDRQEVDNAINQAAREVATRFDFRDTATEVAWADGKEGIRVESSSEDRVLAAMDVLRDKLVRRKVSLKAVDVGEVQQMGQGRSRIDVGLRTAMPADVAKAIVKLVKQSKLKVTPTNMGDKVRMASKSRDALQEVMAMVKAEDYDAPLTFTNRR